MKLNVSRNDLKDALKGMVTFSVLLTVIYCIILLLPNQFGVYDEWQENLLETTKERWPIFLGGIVAISLFFSMLGLAKKIKRKT